MEIKILKIKRNQPERVEIRCHEVTEQVREIADFVRSRQGRLTGYMEGRQFEIPVMDIHYIEAADTAAAVAAVTDSSIYSSEKPEAPR